MSRESGGGNNGPVCAAAAAAGCGRLRHASLLLLTAIAPLSLGAQLPVPAASARASQRADPRRATAAGADCGGQ